MTSNVDDDGWDGMQSTQGLSCRRCGCGYFRVLYTRRAVGRRIVRRRECRHCGKRITTWEKEIGTWSAR